MATVVQRNANGTPDYAGAGISFNASNSPTAPAVTAPATTQSNTTSTSAATAGSTPTVISDSTIRNNVIPQVQDKATKMLSQTDYTQNPYYLRPGESTDAYTTRINALNPTQTATTGQSQDTDTGLGDYDALYKNVFGTTPEADTSYDSSLALLDKMRSTSDQATANQIAGIQSQFNQRQNDLRAAQAAGVSSTNAALARTGGNRSGSGSMAVSAVSRGYIAQMSDADLEEQQAVSQALSAQQNNDYQLLGKQLDVLQQKRQEKLDLTNKLYDNVIAEKKQNQADIQQVVQSAAAQGAPKDVIDAISSSTDPNSAVEAAGPYLQQGTGQLGDYLQYKRDALQKGLTPIDYGTWKDQDDAKQAQNDANKAYATAYATAKGTAAGKAAGTTTAGGGTYNGDYAATIDLTAGAVKGATDTQRQAVTASLQNDIANGDYASAWTTIQQQTKESLSGTNSTRMENAQNLDSTLGDLKDALQAYADAGGNTNILSGTEDNIQTKIGALKTDPQYAALAVQLDSAYQNYRLMLTGANFSQAEASAYASVLPSKSNTLALNMAKIEGAQNAANSTIDGFVKAAVGQGGLEIKDKAQGVADAAVSPKDQVNSYVTDHPDQAQTVANLYKVPGATDQDVLDYLNSLNK